jgi:hypothetical protein
MMVVDLEFYDSDEIKRKGISVSNLGGTGKIGRWVAGSGRGWCGLALTAVHHGPAWRLTGVQVFSSHGGGFQLRFAPTGSQ